MAPSTVFLDQRKMTPKEKNKLRKPTVEKMRRDRINNSIEELKVLLEKEFHKQQPNVKLEKADILEMAVSYLKQQTLPQTNNRAHHNNDLHMEFKDGYSKCSNEVLSFLSLHQKQRTAEIRLMNHFKPITAIHVSPLSPVRHCQTKPTDVTNNTSLWRPW
ncbi:transcription factor HES-5-like [Mixophyes fleayi]|uniref:transcription factor HES-5-like n=1 Tax=Mixophyes fleayi TaxID=3061075 RepID=UPI003F4D72FA